MELRPATEVGGGIYTGSIGARPIAGSGSGVGGGPDASNGLRAGGVPAEGAGPGPGSIKLLSAAES